MEKSESIKNIAKALLKFDNEVGKIGKGSLNPFFKNTYAALPDILESIKEPLSVAGLTVKQFPDGEHGLTTIIIHAESGEYLSSTYSMMPQKNDPQGEGSRITYQRRYALGAVLGLNIDEDDDGNKASEPVKEQPKATTDNREWLSDKNAEIIAERISKGEDLLEKTKATYKISKKNMELLTNAKPK